jgi:hypothetical protein
MDTATWIGILFCVTQSAMFSGLNLAFFSISKLRLQIESSESKGAAKILKMREDSNFLLTTILWGNVSINVLLTLLSNSVMIGATAFLFSTFVITFFGEIIPQAYFSRNALKMATLLMPVFKIYRLLLWPLAKPSAYALDIWLGKEGVNFFREDELQEMIKLHIQDSSTEITRLEGIGALNFFELDDISVGNEGVELDPRSIISLEFEGTKAIFPEIKPSMSDPFLQLLYLSRKPWIVVTDNKGTPRLVLDADAFILEALLGSEGFDPYKHCHRPIMITNSDAKLEDVLPSFRSISNHEGDEIVNDDVILIWADERRIITGADILGRLLKGVTKGVTESNS